MKIKVMFWGFFSESKGGEKKYKVKKRNILAHIKSDKIIN